MSYHIITNIIFIFMFYYVYEDALWYYFKGARPRQTGAQSDLPHIFIISFALTTVAFGDLLR